jgi:hypothetical protein
MVPTALRRPLRLSGATKAATKRPDCSGLFIQPNFAVAEKNSTASLNQHISTNASLIGQITR